MLYGYYISNVFATSPTSTTAIEKLQDYRDTLKSDKDIENFNEALSSHCLDLLICPECGNELHIKSHNEQREFLGQDTYECISDSLCCNNCNWTYSLDD